MLQSAASRLAGAGRALARALYPPACVACGAATEGAGLCGPCWRAAGFLAGPGRLVCDLCGAPLPGRDDGRPDSHRVPCDDCLGTPRPWARGRAALPYDGTGRALVLRLKHGDRPDLAKPLGRWLAQAARPLVAEGTVLVPVPLHWTRLARRRYNQAALLAHAAGAALRLPVLPDALLRPRRTAPQASRARERRVALEGAVVPHPRRGGAMAGRHVLVVDDVMTTGATLAACALAAREAGAREVSVAVLARALRDP